MKIEIRPSVGGIISGIGMLLNRTSLDDGIQVEALTVEELRKDADHAVRVSVGPVRILLTREDTERLFVDGLPKMIAQALQGYDANFLHLCAEQGGGDAGSV